MPYLPALKHEAFKAVVRDYLPAFKGHYLRGPAMHPSTPKYGVQDYVPPSRIVTS